MNHLKWNKNNTVKKVRCITNKADKYKVDSMLTVGKEYDVVNESEEFIFVIDNSERVAGYFKKYFETI